VFARKTWLYMKTSALDNLVFFGRMEGLDGKEAKSQDGNLALMGLAERAKARFRNFRRMKRRVNLAIRFDGQSETFAGAG